MLCLRRCGTVPGARHHSYPAHRKRHLPVAASGLHRKQGESTGYRHSPAPEVLIRILFTGFLQILLEHECMRQIAQMPIILIPIHFDRDPAQKTPSCMRSVVLRPFVTNDFMTGVPAIPGTNRLPTVVSEIYFRTICSMARRKTAIK